IKKIMPWILLCFILIIMVSIIVFPHNPAHDLFLRYLSIISSWPIIILILILVLFFKFEPSIAAWIQKALIKLPQGVEIGAASQMASMIFNVEGLKQIEEKYAEEKKNIHQFYSALVDFERLIRFLYRSQFLLLKGIASTKPQSVMQKGVAEGVFYKQIYLKSAGNPQYTFDSYLNFLKFNGLITEEADNITPVLRILPKAEMFLQYCFLMNYSDLAFIQL